LSFRALLSLCEAIIIIPLSFTYIIFQLSEEKKKRFLFDLSYHGLVPMLDFSILLSLLLTNVDFFELCVPSY